MNISSVSPVVVAPAEAVSATPTRAQSSERAALVQAVNTVNQSNVFGDNRELTFVVDRQTHQMLTRVIDRQTQEVVMQIPPEYVLRLAEQVKSQMAAE